MRQLPDSNARTAEHERRTNSLDEPGVASKAGTIAVLALGAAAVLVEPAVAVAALVVAVGLTAVAVLPFAAVIVVYRTLEAVDDTDLSAGSETAETEAVRPAE